MKDKAITAPRPASRPAHAGNAQPSKPLTDAQTALQQSLDRRW